MKRYTTLLALSLALTASLASAQAATLTYDLDRSKNALDNDTLAMCGVPTVIQLDAAEDLSTVVIKRVLGAKDAKAIQRIEASNGALSGVSEPYQGEYRTKVAIVQIDGGGYYKPAVYKRAEVTTYGSPAAPKAFELDVELLNFRNSAELGEDMACAKLAYTLR